MLWDGLTCVGQYKRYKFKMTNNLPGPKLKLRVRSFLCQAYVYKCQFKKCCNFFTATSNNSLKYCQIHPRIHSISGFEK
jgi:hypothetical protein